MITKETVFILGAGASTPYGYPSGEGLKDMICDNLPDLLKNLKARAGLTGASFETDHKEIIQEKSVTFKGRFCASPIGLIDNFITRNPDISEAGRTLISLCILNAEKESRFSREIPRSERKFDWYSLLFNIMVNTLKEADSYIDFKKNKVSFITFNYDRSLEYFLYDKLKATFGSIDNKNRPVDLVPFKFIHVYGKIDNFEWEDPPGLDYKSNYFIRDILRVADNIKLIHERNDAFLEDIEKTIAEAKNIFFLGFGYDEDNMRALGWPKSFNNEKMILGTAYETTEDRIIELRKMLQEGFSRKNLKYTSPIIKSLDCCSLLKKYQDKLYE